ncbi:MAG TPA: peroxide stress protein YaaA [Ramlibacter sp.]|nr:peroxide stress protein YaaA [Ramlibacter sp.]
MLFLLSPAKTLDYTSPIPDVPHTLPAFLDDSARLIEVLRRKSPQEIASLMDISDPLAALNAGRYEAWTRKFTERNARQAVLAFDGDVYDGLQARQLAPGDLDWAQQHLRVLSGLYGVLRPLDWMQPYRLEMGTALKVGNAANLYQYWGSRIAEHLNRDLAADKTPVIVNLASQEYFRAVDRNALKARVIECVFEEWKPSGWKVVSFFAKKARGLMARYAIMKRVETPRKLEQFKLEGYAFDPAASQPERLVFRRRTAP